MQICRYRYIGKFLQWGTTHLCREMNENDLMPRIFYMKDKAKEVKKVEYSYDVSIYAYCCLVDNLAKHSSLSDRCLLFKVKIRLCLSFLKIFA